MEGGQKFEEMKGECEHAAWDPIWANPHYSHRRQRARRNDEIVAAVAEQIRVDRKRRGKKKVVVID